MNNQLLKKPVDHKSDRFFVFHTHSNKKPVKAYPATPTMTPFVFSRPGTIHLYRVNGLVMGVVR